MTALAERLRPDDARPFAAAFGITVFLVSWGLVHRGFYAHGQIVDTGVYQSYGDRILDGEVPYRDFPVEYPPGSLPVFVLPSLAPGGDFVGAFEWLMAALGAAATAVTAWVRPTAAGFVAVSPLLVGSLVLSRFDLWPAALTAAAVAALLADRHRLGWAVLGAACAAKLYPFVLVPLALAWTQRRARPHAALLGLGVFTAIVLPFVVIAPGGVWDSVYGQASRPLQIESLGGALAMALSSPFVLTSHGSQNLAGYEWLAALSATAQALVLGALWLAFARRPHDLARFAAACVAVFIAFGKVLSPQFLIWLVPLVPLVRGLRGWVALVLLTAALVLTQVWFPLRYWDYVAGGDIAAVVLARDLVLVALVAVLALPRLAPRR